MLLSGLISFAAPFLLEKLPAGSYEKARLRFAHAETVVPFSCLLGLFHEGFGVCLTFHLRCICMCHCARLSFYVYVCIFVKLSEAFR